MTPTILPRQCNTHNVPDIPFEEWCQYIEDRLNSGEIQQPCPTCGKLFFEDEM